MVWVIVVIAIVVLLLLIVVGMYNKLVRLRNRSENAWAQVDVQLRRRYDLIPNLIEAVKGYAAHQRGTFEAVAEAYPQLRATENFQQLQGQLAETEQKIAVSRQVYNDTVLTYDNALETVPTSIVAGLFNFRPRAYFETEGVTREAPSVQFPPWVSPAAASSRSRRSRSSGLRPPPRSRTRFRPPTS